MLRTFHIHTNAKPGDLLRYSDGGLKLVRSDGSKINVIKTPDGKLMRSAKLNKKQRHRLKDSQVDKRPIPSLQSFSAAA